MGSVKHARGGLIALSATVVALLVPGAAGAQQLAPAAGGLPEPASPDLIDRAQEAGRIDNERANLYRVYALTNDARLPAAYESDTPFDGTVELLQARRELRFMEPGPERSAVAAALRAPPTPVTNCDLLSNTLLLDSEETDHFYIQYNEAALEASLTIDDYAQSLETAWAKEVIEFGWAAPPVTAMAQTDLGGKYHVRIDALGPVLYGFVSSVGTYAGPVGDNPNTLDWDDEDADASCMGLNQDYSGFPSPPRESLDATTAHELNHSLQFGYGGLNGDNVPDDNFVEGGATWMEDEAQDTANDNYFYLYPEFTSSMGEHEGDIYAYWLTWRGLTERFGTNAANAGEDVMQRFWELTSRNDASNLAAMDQAIAPEGVSLARAYHDYAISANFTKACGGGYALPHCFEEGAGYVGAAGETDPHGAVPAAGGSYEGEVEDNYTLNWIALPTTGGPYPVTVSNDSRGGALRTTVACDTGSQLTLAELPAVVSGGQTTSLASFDPAGCQEVVAVITNESQTAPNPSQSLARAYTVSTAAGGSAAGSGSGPGTEYPQPVADTVDPVLTRLRLSSRRFRAARSGRAISAAPLGTRVRYRLSEAATVTVRYERRLTGRRVGNRCRAVTRRNRGRKKCFRFVLVPGSARRGGKAGPNSFRLTGRMNGRALRPGVYRLRLSARDGAGNTSKTRRSGSFRIVRR